MPPTEVLVISDDPEVDVPMDDSGLDSNDDTACLLAGDAGTPPGLEAPVASARAALGSAFEIVAREFIESEILGNFDAMLVDNTNRKSCDGSSD
jgi:hypothetical protein